ncbi:hypothetical protein DL765_009913 [Monosporascus sp. GIB2]|nr:hypothetical protein DL765_009913 [Monosporascus sp. GIB2]
MAVLDVPGIEVAVQINGRDSIDDTEFTIRYKASPGYNWEGCRDHVLRFWTFADGLNLSKKILFKTDALYGRCIRNGGFSKYDQETKETRVYNCKFPPISTVDAGREHVTEDSCVAKKLGLIEVEAYRSTFAGIPIHTGRIYRPLGYAIFRPPFDEIGEAEILVELERMEQLEESLEEKYGVDEESRPVKREIDEVYNHTRDQPPRQPAKRSRLASGREMQFVDLTDD